MKIKNNKGFSLIEILVAMTLIGVLSAIAIPSYNSYRKDANKTVLKSDAGNAYKAIHVYNAVNSTFCANLAGLKLNSLTISDTYKGGDNKRKSFVGFASSTCDPTIPPAELKKENEGGVSLNKALCVLADDTFKFAVANKFGGEEVGFSVNDKNSSPKQGGDYCKDSAGDAITTAGCDEDACGNTDSTDSDYLDATCGAGSWESGGQLCQ